MRQSSVTTSLQSTNVCGIGASLSCGKNPRKSKGSFSRNNYNHHIIFASSKDDSYRCVKLVHAAYYFSSSKEDEIEYDSLFISFAKKGL